MNKLVELAKKFFLLGVIRIFNCFPIKKNKIFFLSYYGSNYGGNPKYITDYILNNKLNDQLDVVWAFTDLPSKKEIKGIRKVKRFSLRYFYELCTSKVAITNYRSTEFFVKRKGQYYIQTWHSSLRLKHIEKDAEESLKEDYIKMAKRDSLKCDLLLSGCRYSTEIFKRAFWYEGKVFEHGTPRNDVFFQDHQKMKEKILGKLNVPKDSKVVLYAPTFRKNNNLDVYELNDRQIVQCLEKRFGGKWVFIVKLHPHLIHKSNQLMFSEKVIDLTAYDDIQELLSISDILVSDYSSVIFDFSITYRPCFLYVPDLMEYVSKERKLYFDLNELPFISSTSQDQLLEHFKIFNQEEYQQRLTTFLQNIGSYENGRACEYLLKHIIDICYKEKRGYQDEAVQNRLYNRSI